MAYTNEQKAEAIVDSAFSTDAEAAEKHGCSPRSIQRWRSDMDTDPDLSQNVALKWQAFRDAETWADDASRTIRKAMGFVRRAVEHLDPADPASLEAITRAIQTLTNAKLTADVIDARLAQSNRRHDAQGQQSVAGYIGRTAKGE